MRNRRGTRKYSRGAAESIAATDAAKNFGRLVDRVRESGATYIVERHGRPIAQIGPVAPARTRTLRDLARAARTTPRLDEKVLRYIEQSIDRLNRPEVPANPWAR
jgi:prevent-host-death family protein